MKRISLALLCVITVFVFVSCSTNKNATVSDVSEPKITFESMELMREAVDGVWMNCKSGDYLIIKDGQLSIFDEQTKQVALNKLSGQANDFASFENFYVRFLKECGEEIEYDYKRGCVILKSTNTIFFEMQDHDDAYDENSILFTKYSVTENELKKDIAEKYINLKYPNAPTNKDVQYDKYGNIGKNFTISGTAELDNYYNWGYKDFEAGYFCIQVTPTYGSYSDRWYIYASRSEFSELFDKLKNGSQNVNLVARLIFADTGSSNMATLVECF